MAYVEKENLILAAQNAQQSGPHKRFAIGGKPDVMRFVADRRWAGQWHSAQHFAVAWRTLIEIDDRDEIRFHVRFVSGPDDQGVFGAIATVGFVVLRWIGVILRVCLPGAVAEKQASK